MYTAQLNGTDMRWVSELANYYFFIKYRTGRKSLDCDYLSRNSIIPNEFTNEIDLQYVTATITSLQAQESQEYVTIHSTCPSL